MYWTSHSTSRVGMCSARYSTCGNKLAICQKLPQSILQVGKYILFTVLQAFCKKKTIHFVKMCGPGSSVSIGTHYGLDSQGLNPDGDEIFRQTSPGAHPASCKMGTRSFSGVKCIWGILLTTHPLLVPWSWNSRAIPLPTLWATTGL